jgi:hypothetical protein
MAGRTSEAGRQNYVGESGGGVRSLVLDALHTRNNGTAMSVHITSVSFTPQRIGTECR